jgi:GT2 family glycosyltransferase
MGARVNAATLHQVAADSKLQLRPPGPTLSRLPAFSIIVPTRNRPNELSACLDTLVALDYPRSSFEIIVVDDGGELPASIIDRAKQSVAVRLLKQPHRGPASARNLGAAAARHKYVAFTDDDCAADPGWLRALAAAFNEQPRAIIGGTTINAAQPSLFAVASQNVIDFLYDYQDATPDASRYFAANNVACSRDICGSIGGFDESFRRAAAEDRDLCERWSGAGLPLALARSAVVTHGSVHGSFTRYVAQHFRYGRGACGLRTARVVVVSVGTRRPPASSRD